MQPNRQQQIEAWVNEAEAREREAAEHARKYRMDQAVEPLRRALELRVKLRDEAGEAFDRFQLAVALEHSGGKNVEIVRLFKRALLLFEVGGRPDWQVRTLNKLIPFLDKAGRRAEAEALTERLAAMEGKVEGAGLDAVKYRVALARARGDSSAVAEALRNAVSAGILSEGSDQIRRLRFFSGVLSREEVQGLIEETKADGQDGLRAHLELDEAGTLVMEGAPDRAVELYQDARELAMQTGDPVSTTFSSLGLVFCFDALGRRADALDVLLMSATWMGMHFGKAAKDAFFPVFESLRAKWGVEEFDKLFGEFRSNRLGDTPAG